MHSFFTIEAYPPCFSYKEKVRKLKASMFIPTRPREFHIQEGNYDKSSFIFFGLASHH